MAGLGSGLLSVAGYVTAFALAMAVRGIIFGVG
jgi:hypothetical protein